MTAGAAARVLLACGLVAAPSDGLGQGYRFRLDTRFQSVEFRGVALDSVARSDVVADGDRAPRTADGFAVRCRSGLAYCTYYRPGPAQRGQPLVATGDLVAWGLVPHLSIRASTRVGTDVAEGPGWPGAEPRLQLLEGYAQYASPTVRARVGRTHHVSRFGFVGFDGGSVRVNGPVAGLSATAYGGWGLARGVALPVTSPALNPLDDFQPRQRGLVVGADAGWSGAPGRARLVYLREFRRGSGDVVAERGGVEVSGRLPAGIGVSAGADYDLAAGWWGSAEATVSVDVPGGIAFASAGARRYRPHFELWTIWGAFSPVPYRALWGAVSTRPLRGLELRARGETYEYEDAEAATPLVGVETDGWRWSAGGRYAGSPRWAVTADLHGERGTGAATVGYDGSVEVTPGRVATLAVHAGVLERPLEFRFNEARVVSFGARVTLAPTGGLRFTAELVRYDERRERPDAGTLDWAQNRLSVWGTFIVGSDPASRSLPAAVAGMPRRSGPR